MSGSRFIGVVGGSGSGKSWFAASMRDLLGDDAGHLSLDDFYRDLGHLPEEERDGVNFDDPAAIDWEALREVLDCLERGETARIPVYDFATHTRMPDPCDLGKARPHRRVGAATVRGSCAANARDVRAAATRLGDPPGEFPDVRVRTRRVDRGTANSHVDWAAVIEYAAAGLKSRYPRFSESIFTND